MNAEWPLPEWSFNHLGNGIGNKGGISTGRFHGRDSSMNLLRESAVGSGFVQGLPICIGGNTRMQEVVRSSRERPGNDDGGLNAPSEPVLRRNLLQERPCLPLPLQAQV